MGRNATRKNSASSPTLDDQSFLIGIERCAVLQHVMDEDYRKRIDAEYPQRLEVSRDPNVIVPRKE